MFVFSTNHTWLNSSSMHACMQAVPVWLMPFMAGWTDVITTGVPSHLVYVSSGTAAWRAQEFSFLACPQHTWWTLVLEGSRSRPRWYNHSCMFDSCVSLSLSAEWNRESTGCVVMRICKLPRQGASHRIGSDGCSQAIVKPVFHRATTNFNQ
jgi:hypothetical protein